MATNKSLYSDLPIHPGEYLEEVIDELAMTKDELAKRLNRPAAKLSAIFKGQKAITPDTALQLDKVVGVPAHIWTGLEAEYRLAIARKQQNQEQQRLNTESRLVTRFRYADLVRLGIVTKKTRPKDKVLELQKFFGVTSLETVCGLHRYQAAFRSGISGESQRSPESVAAWLRIGELDAQKRQCAPFDKKKLKDVLHIIRAMTLHVPEHFQDNLRRALANSGVALVLCPSLPGTYAHGATFWLGREKAVVMMTLRYKWADVFWFSLFHELGHIFLHNRQAVILEGSAGNESFDNQEEAANRFAADTLIPPMSYKEFVKKHRFYPVDIESFASQLGISPGIVAGRLQNDKYLDRSWHNRLRTRFEWKQAS
jgi:HTH-type transcriptional regulator/antitoxin HigA